MAARTIEPMEYSRWCKTLSIAENNTDGKETLLKECYDMLEKDLHILGATAVEDKLQVGVPSRPLSAPFLFRTSVILTVKLARLVPSALLSMRAAGLAIWLLTGNSQLGRGL